ncbi:uncharacterized protein LOC134543361 [Bacillus rossius redtenbacheri]|uniref:uncharacterized protein LOC134543361 n=1 Tax=Bacillus rossius redtenbacheri TaxID=93214 RepID=UPI002FDE7B53
MAKMPKNLTIFDREREMKLDGFYIFDQRDKIMMCKFCNVRVDWTRKDTCKKHVANDTHKRKKQLFCQANSTVSKQISISDTVKNNKLKVQKQEFVSDFVNMMLESNIPLEKADHPAMREWLNTHVEGAGDLPSANTLRETYVPKIGQSNKEAVRHAVENKQIVFLCDETTDKVGRCIFVVLIRVLRCSSVPLMYVGGVKELTAATGSECSRAILSIVAELGIKFENVVGVITDSAKYMTTCVTSLKCVFSDGMVHVQCWAHKLNIIASLWSANLTELNMCVANAKHAFVNARKRKHRYMSFLKDKYPEDETKHVLFPLPIMTRWTSWYKSANYVGEHVDDLVEFLSAEEEGSSAIVHFKNLSQDDVAVIKCSSVFLIEHCIKTIDSIVLLEGANYAFSHQEYPILMDLKNTFTLISRGILGEDTCTSIAKLSTQVKQHSLRENLVSVGLKCVTKLSDLMNRIQVKTSFCTSANFFTPVMFRTMLLMKNCTSQVQRRFLFFANFPRQNFWKATWLTNIRFHNFWLKCSLLMLSVF